MDTRQARTITMGKQSLLLYLLSVTLCAPIGWAGPLWLAMGWQFVVGCDWWYSIVPRTVYALAVWMGCRAFVQSPSKREPWVLAAGILSILAISAAVASALFLPKLAR